VKTHLPFLHIPQNEQKLCSALTIPAQNTRTLKPEPGSKMVDGDGIAGYAGDPLTV